MVEQSTKYLYTFADLLIENVIRPTQIIRVQDLKALKDALFDGAKNNYAIANLALSTPLMVDKLKTQLRDPAFLRYFTGTNASTVQNNKTSRPKSVYNFFARISQIEDYSDLIGTNAQAIQRANFYLAFYLYSSRKNQVQQSVSNAADFIEEALDGYAPEPAIILWNQANKLEWETNQNDPERNDKPKQQSADNKQQQVYANLPQVDVVETSQAVMEQFTKGKLLAPQTKQPITYNTENIVRPTEKLTIPQLLASNSKTILNSGLGGSYKVGTKSQFNEVIAKLHIPRDTFPKNWFVNKLGYIAIRPVNNKDKARLVSKASVSFEFRSNPDTKRLYLMAWDYNKLQMRLNSSLVPKVETVKQKVGKWMTSIEKRAKQCIKNTKNPTETGKFYTMLLEQIQTKKLNTVQAKELVARRQSSNMRTSKEIAIGKFDEENQKLYKDLGLAQNYGGIYLDSNATS